MTELESVLVERDGISLRKAQQQIAEARERVYEGEDPEELLHNDFGLEPDYILDLMFVV